MPKLYIYPKNDDPYNIVLKGKKLTFGRSQKNDIVIEDPFCSGIHVSIYPSDSNYFVCDESSKNGTFVNGKKLVSPVKLKKGDEILIGSTRIIFDMKLSTNVELKDETGIDKDINTIVQVDKLLDKQDMNTTMQAGLIPENLEKIKEDSRSFSVLSEVSGALILHKPLDELLEYIMDLICENMYMDRGILMIKEGNPPQMIPKVVRINNEKLKNKKIQVSQSIINTVVERSSSVLTRDAQADKRFKAKESIIKSNIHSAMCVPLYNNKEIIGIIYSDRISLLDQFSDSDLKLLTLLSNLAAVKIENAKLVEKAIENEKMEKELALAAQIQKDLLPKENPEFEKMDITGSNVPCYQVGGDYFDFIELDSKRLGIVIADVSGKGVGASLLMASLRACLHSEVDSGCSLEKMALRLNDFVHKSSSTNCFITFFYCEYDNEKNELRYINAGHNPPLLIEKKGTVDHFEISGLCLGMFPSSEYEEKKITLSPGDTLLFYTDGITESRNKKGEEFTEERLINIAKQNSKLPVQDLMKKIFEEVNEFTSGVNQMDDMTMIVLKRTH